ncbi:hypothetical protein [Cellulophaga lytica]|uniref:Uncharacterized protein n=1 Tax=Cellulophaga lytica (strain ATCC 23178 / DSM 7489 / JCM 8516 / NBRC 14961 / NCIMB 1423 / VKM B-1433 / Cy l20) TaxID=867900 RepID=F0RFU6_CELLC|nr:hypothetical protein [Cellulophaga lytica]ADY30071.1 hypothetical protein Celly_2251 [Cellulophaga lytica DSM 7489]AIM61068.1 hypothetical protein IX49_11230 [Cellulophaga lytica]MDO6853556.1 hypothetical protein [Cellulophaga lytica]WQG75766.1 hypothetical protein SR888_08700 [Cellulophaga lytica]SNQ44813.1 conserved hypothetical protein [Cellulophaga lytica]
MNYNDFKSSAKKFSNEVLFDSLLHRDLCNDERRAYTEEIHKRGLESQLAEATEANNARKNSIIDSVKNLPKQELLNVIVFNIDKFTEEQLTIFRNEAVARGLQNELTAALNEKAKSDKEFRDTVINNADNIGQMMNNFTEHLFTISPELKKSVEKAEKKSKANRIVGIVLLVIGILLLSKTGWNTISFGITALGIFLFVRGVLK